jgi:hypothetical protein
MRDQPTPDGDEQPTTTRRGAVVDRSEVPGDAPPEAAAGGPHDAVETLPSAEACEAWQVFRRDL